MNLFLNDLFEVIVNLFYVKDFGEVENGNETDLMWAIANIGPVPVAVDASEAS